MRTALSVLLLATSFHVGANELRPAPYENVDRLYGEVSGALQSVRMLVSCHAEANESFDDDGVCQEINAVFRRAAEAIADNLETLADGAVTEEQRLMLRGSIAQLRDIPETDDADQAQVHRAEAERLLQRVDGALEELADHLNRKRHSLSLGAQLRDIFASNPGLFPANVERMVYTQLQDVEGQIDNARNRLSDANGEIERAEDRLRQVQVMAAEEEVRGEVARRRLGELQGDYRVLIAGLTRLAKLDVQPVNLSVQTAARRDHDLREVIGKNLRQYLGEMSDNERRHIEAIEVTTGPVKTLWWWFEGGKQQTEATIKVRLRQTPAAESLTTTLRLTFRPKSGTLDLNYRSFFKTELPERLAHLAAVEARQRPVAELVAATAAELKARCEALLKPD